MTDSRSLDGTGHSVLAAAEEWTVVETPTDRTRHAGVGTATGAFAAGGGEMLRRTGVGWQRVLDDAGDGRVASDSGKTASSSENGATGEWVRVAPGPGAAMQTIGSRGPTDGYAVGTVVET